MMTAEGQLVKKEEGTRDTHRTRGYVHGHIHQHKDHTHIHGHIHNRDYEQKSEEHKDSEAEGKKRKQLEDELFCKEVLCQELDDCFFLDCSDFNSEECCDSNCLDCPKKRDIMEVTCCDNTECLKDLPATNEPCKTDSGYICEMQEDSSSCSQCEVVDPNDPNHENSLCREQTLRIPLFEGLIDKVYQRMDKQHNPKKEHLGNNESDVLVPKDISKDLPKEFQLHFPKECHLGQEDTNGILNNEGMWSQKGQNQHGSHHQSSFHTTIPNNIGQSSEIHTTPSDFDFFMQFDNLNSTMNMMMDNDIDNNDTKSGTSDDWLDGYVVPKNKAYPMPSREKSVSSPKDLFSCQWNSCHTSVESDSFLKHLMEQHINQQNAMSESGDQGFHCKWNECNYVNSDLESLLLHMNTHTTQQTVLPTPERVLFTPNSNSSLPKQEDFYITNFTVMPKAQDSTEKKSGAKCCCSDAASHFSCCWQVGVDKDGVPIKCGCTHANEGELQQHLITCHIGSGKSRYRCEWIGCDRHNGRDFIQRQKVLRHIHIHTNYKPFKCKECQSKFATNALLQQHMRVHSGEKPYQCATCLKQFATSSSLSIHNRVHTGEKPLVCKVCNKRFSESSNLAKHMRVHNRSFKCEECGKIFDRKLDYTRHMKSHSSLPLEQKKFLQWSSTVT